MKRRYASLILAVFVECQATLIEVPNSYPTITEGLMGTSQGDTILVHRGTYSERLIMPSHDVVLVSSFFFTGDSADLNGTIIDAGNFAGEDRGSVLTFDSTGSAETVVCGFVMTGGHGKFWNMPNDIRRWGGAVSIIQASPTIRNCIITGNSCTNDCAIYAERSNSRIAHCRIFGNCGESGVVSFYYNMDPDGVAIFEWNDVFSNYGCDWIADYLYYPRVSALGMDLVVRNNYLHDYEGRGMLGVQYYASGGECVGNTFERLTARDNAFVVKTNYANIAFEDNIFRDLTLGDYHALSVDPSGPAAYVTSIRRNWFENITSIVGVGAGPAAIFVSAPNIEMEENVFLACNGGTGAVQFSQTNGFGCRGYLRRNQFFGNYSTSSTYNASCLTTLDQGPLCEVSNNWFEGNGTPICLSFVAVHPGWDCANNYWGDSTGPYHPTQNPDGRGDTVDVNTNVIPWLTSPPDLDVDIRERLTLQPDDWTMEYAFPNPFNASVSIRIVAQKTQPMGVSVYNIMGQQVSNVWQGVIPQNEPTLVRWNGTDDRGVNAASGVYCFVAQPYGPLNSAPKTVKAVLLR